MRHQQKRDQATSKRKKNVGHSESPRNYILSFRVSDQERRELERVTQASSRNVSDIAREAIELWMRKHRVAA